MKKFLIIGLLLVLGCGSSFAQGINNIKINEILVNNESDLVDGFGNHASWIEFFNTGFERVNIGGCYIGVEYTDGTTAKYRIPSRDTSTNLAPQSYALFFCNGKASSTYYTNFTLEGAKRVDFYSANGKDILDSVTFDYASMKADVSIGLSVQHTEDGMHPLDHTSPNGSNEILIETPAHEIFRQRDPSGAVLALTAMSVVFSALILIFIVLKVFGKLMVNSANRKLEKASEKSEIIKTRGNDYSDETVAAISMALHLYKKDLHDKEDAIITFNVVSRFYSPWSSKIHGLTKLPQIKK